ncbi:hypothetical protein AC578_5129 [Pseudocercospora eumusae]|uniref:Uncharacterized protein n=1 Tax=Pseudocercospora eumusae TaxID=321146 RepID=A0A139HMI9_9PEZI|nr:hypothetical protein AC578_5129 [Pseudocercospora eumusae]
MGRACPSPLGHLPAHRTSHPPNPLPISNPLVAGMLSIACASFASSLSKHGSPKPLGVFLMTQVTVPPMLSCLSLYSAIKSPILLLASSLGHLTGLKRSTSSRVTVSISFRKSGFEA